MMKRIPEPASYCFVKIFLAKLFRSFRVIPSEKTNMGDAVVRNATENQYKQNITQYNHENISSLTLTRCFLSRMEFG